MFSEQEPFDADHLYSQGCMIAPNEGYALTDDCVYHFNGDAALVDQVLPSYFPDCLFVQSVPMACEGSAPEPIMGDVDSSGEVNVADALLTLRYSMGIVDENALDLSAADIDGSGEVNVADALMILRRAMGLV